MRAERQQFKAFKYGVAVLSFCVFCWLLVVFPPPAPKQSLEIRSREGASKNGKPALFIVVSNASPCSVTYKGDAIWVAYLKGDAWITNSVGLGPDEFVLHHPHVIMQFENFSDIPIGTTKFKAGVSFTSLTWRSKLIWWKRRPNEFLDPIADYLWELDKSHRSKTEWSRSFDLDTN